MKEKAPYMPFYGREFYQDENVLVMTLEQEGAYLRLLWNCWQEGSIPADPAKLAAISKNLPVKRFKSSIWPALEHCFVPTADGRLIHPKAESVRQEKEEFHAGQRARGKAGAEQRWRHRRSASPPPSPAMGESREPALVADSPLWSAWERFIDRYPNRIEVDLAAQTWLSLVDTGAITETMLPELEAGLTRWMESDQWSRDEGRYVPSPVKWLRDKRWLDHPPASAEAKAAERSTRRSRAGTDPNARFIAPWEEE